MISSIRSLCFNDDHQTFTIALPSQYMVYRCEPFGLIFTRECEDLSLGNVATYEGYRFLALTGSPSPSNFNSKCIRIYDHQTGQICFENQFSDHILTMCLGNNIAIICMHCKFEVWNTSINQKIAQYTTGLNVHVPVAISPDSNLAVISGPDSHKLNLLHNLSQSPRDYAFVADEASLSVVKFSADSKLLATIGFNSSSVFIWDIKSMNIVLTLSRPSNDLLHTMDFSPDLHYIVTCSKDGIVRIFDISGRKPNNRAKIDPMYTVKISQVCTMPRCSWMSSDQIGITTLEGIFYKLTFNGHSIEQESTEFNKRGA